MLKNLIKPWINLLSGLAVLSMLGLSHLACAETVPAEVRFAYAGGPRVWILGKIDGSFDKAFGTKVKWIPFSSGGEVLTLFAAREIDICRGLKSKTVRTEISAVLGPHYLQL